jgi:toxin YoeB
VKLVFDREAWRDYVAWQSENPAVVERINQLIEDSLRSPFKGIGKPEPLKRNLAGWWSRRITGEHRLVYRVSGTGEAQALQILSLRYHY